MRILETELLTGATTVAEALRQAQRLNRREGDKLVAAIHNRRVKVYSLTALERAGKTYGKSALLDQLPRWTGSAIAAIPRAAPAEVRDAIVTRQLSSGLQNYLGTLKRPLVFLRQRDGKFFLVSDSEGNLVVTYRCKDRGHPYYPPPAWFQGRLCWCKSEIVRED